MNNYIETNKELWNKRTEVHLESDFYDVKNFLDNGNSLNPIEVELLGDIEGKNILHLQCHFGQDTLSLARVGAYPTGVDFSEKAIDAAKNLSEKTALRAKFICSDVYETEKHLQEQFDIVYTSYGTIVWLPDLNKWAEQIAKRLKPNGKFVFVEFHPVMWMFNEKFSEVEYSYFNKESIEEELEGTYTDGGQNLKSKSVSWNHSLGDVFEALRKQGLQVDNFQEFDYSPYDCFSNTVQVNGGYQIKGLEGKLPMVYALEASFRK